MAAGLVPFGLALIAAGAGLLHLPFAERRAGLVLLATLLLGLVPLHWERSKTLWIMLGLFGHGPGHPRPTPLPAPPPHPDPRQGDPRPARGRAAPMTAPAPPAEREATASRPDRRRPLLSWVGGLLVLAGIVVIGGALLLDRATPPPPAPPGSRPGGAALVAPTGGLGGVGGVAGVSRGGGGRARRAAVGGGRGVGVGAGAAAEVGPVQGFAGSPVARAGARCGSPRWPTAAPAACAPPPQAPGPAWIRFRVSGTIRLATPLPVTSDKTVDGRGADVTLAGRGVVVEGGGNVILTGLTLRGGPGAPATQDAVLIWRRASGVWLDHLDIAGWPDEAIDISQGATDVTVSWSRIHDQDKAILVGSWGDNTTTDHVARVTIHHTWFDRTGQRNPRAVRYSQVHAFNNLLRGWTGVGMSTANWAELASDHNLVEAGSRENALLSNASGRDRARRRATQG